MTGSTKKRVGFIVLAAIIATALAVAFWPRAETEDQEVGPSEPKLNEQYGELIVGRWEDDYKGRRTLTVRADGTATMVVEPSGVGALFAKRLTFHEEWSINDGHLTQKAIGGEPEGRVNFVLKTQGDESTQKILELTEKRMLLLDADGETKYDWRRVVD